MKEDGSFSFLKQTIATYKFWSESSLQWDLGAEEDKECPDKFGDFFYQNDLLTV